MLARKCNRCGLCFDPFISTPGRMAEFSNPIFRTAEDIREHKTGKKLMPEETSDAIVDLCPECTEAFATFMRNGAVESTPISDGFFEKYVDSETKLDQLRHENDILLNQLRDLGNERELLLLELKTQKATQDARIHYSDLNKEKDSEDRNDEQTEIKSAVNHFLHSVLRLMGVGDLVCSDGRGKSDNPVRNGKSPERKSETFEESDDRSEVRQRGRCEGDG